MRSLFMAGEFILRSGARSRWRINCDSLTEEDWEVLGLMAMEVMPPFGKVEGVPQGGLPFAEALQKYAMPNCKTLLIAEDVVTTGGSMERHRAGREAVGVAAFARGNCPAWVKPLFRLATREGRGGEPCSWCNGTGRASRGEEVEGANE